MKSTLAGFLTLWGSVGFLFPQNAFSLSVTPLDPWVVSTSSNTNTLYIGDSATAVGFVDSGQGYKLYDLTSIKTSDANGEQMLVLKLNTSSSFDTSGGKRIYVGAYAMNEAGLYTIEVPIARAKVSGGNLVGENCNNCSSYTGAHNNEQFRVEYTPGDNLHIGIYLSDICRIANTYEGADDLYGNACSGGVLQLPSTVGTPISTYLRFVVGAYGTTSELDDDQEHYDLTVKATHGGPQFSRCPNGQSGIAGAITPGDGVVEVDLDQFTPVAQSTSAPPDDVVMIARKCQAGNCGGHLPAADSAYASTSGQLVARFGITSGKKTVSGFENATETNNTYYRVAFMVRSAAGIFGNPTLASANCPSVASTNYYDFIQTSRINGFLKEGKCFIATAAFHDPNAVSVKLFREFRDRILSRTSLGARFIKWYYRVSPPLARWLWDSPMARRVTIQILIPLQAIVSLILHPYLFLIILGASVMGLGALFVQRSSRRHPPGINFGSPTGEKR